MSVVLWLVNSPYRSCLDGKVCETVQKGTSEIAVLAQTYKSLFNTNDTFESCCFRL
jgi:hypothetical protein